MRQIKFRAWFTSGEDTGNGPIEKGQMLCDELAFEEYAPLNDHLAGCPTLMQFTGLKDKNGKEIYEGDIVKIPDNWDEYGMAAGEKREIIFSYGGFRFKPRNNRCGKGYWLEDDCTYEVIGNIYENPELLKEEA